MKLFSLIVTLFFVTISGMEHSRHHHHSLFNSAKTFISSSTLSQIDADKINEMIELVKTIIAEGEADRQSAEDKQAAAQDDVNTKSDAHADAIAATGVVRDDLAAGESQRLTYVANRDEAKRIYDEADVVQKSALTDRDAKAKTNTEQGQRISDEKATFEQIKTYIGEITAEEADIEIKKGRNLLSVVDYKHLLDVDPTDLSEVLDLVDQLILDGETERNGYINAFNNAETVYNDAVATANAAKTEWEITIGQVTRQEKTNDDLGLDLVAAEEAETSAADSLNDARTSLSAQDAFFRV
jgi:hypothetical protein